MDKKMKISRSAGIVVIIILMILLIVGAVAVSYALFTDKQTGTVNGQTGTVDVELHEDFYTSNQHGNTLDTPNQSGIETDRKVFWGESKGNKKAYVRAKIIITFEWYNEDTTKWETASIPESCVQYAVNAPGWIEGDNGFWYYSKILLPSPPALLADSVTTKFYVQDAKLTSAVPAFYADKTLRFTMHVQMESAQATHEAYKRIFGFTGTQDLPAGVERL